MAISIPDETWLGRRARRRRRDENSKVNNNNSSSNSNNKKSRHKSSDFQVVQDSSESVQLANDHFQQFFNHSANSTFSPLTSLEREVPPSSLPILEFNPGSGSGLLKASSRPTVRAPQHRPTRPTIIIYATVQPETVIIPIVCSIIIFPIVVLATICFLKHYNERQRAKDRFRAGFQHGARQLFTMGKIGVTSQGAPNNANNKNSSNSKSSRMAANQFQFNGMPELELETVFELERDCSDSSSSINNGNNKEDRSNSQPHLLPPGRNHSTFPAEPVRLKNVPKLDPDDPDGEANQRTLTTGLSSLNCDIVVTIEPPQPQPETEPEPEPESELKPETNPEEVGSHCCNEVVVVLEDDESLFNKDFNEYQETAL